MGVDLIVTKSIDRKFRETGQQIALDDWLAHVQRDPELTLRRLTGPGGKIRHALRFDLEAMPRLGQEFRMTATLAPEAPAPRSAPLTKTQMYPSPSIARLAPCLHIS